MAYGFGYFGHDPDSCHFFKNGYQEKLAQVLGKPAATQEEWQAFYKQKET